jgi:hypothetical protein
MYEKAFLEIKNVLPIPVLLHFQIRLLLSLSLSITNNYEIRICASESFFKILLKNCRYFTETSVLRISYSNLTYVGFQPIQKLYHPHIVPGRFPSDHWTVVQPASVVQ